MFCPWIRYYNTKELAEPSFLGLFQTELGAIDSFCAFVEEYAFITEEQSRCARLFNHHEEWSLEEMIKRMKTLFKSWKDVISFVEHLQCSWYVGLEVLNSHENSKNNSSSCFYIPSLYFKQSNENGKVLVLGKFDNEKDSIHALLDRCVEEKLISLPNDERVPPPYSWVTTLLLSPTPFNIWKKHINTWVDALNALRFFSNGFDKEWSVVYECFELDLVPDRLPTDRKIPDNEQLRLTWFPDYEDSYNASHLPTPIRRHDIPFSVSSGTDVFYTKLVLRKEKEDIFIGIFTTAELGCRAILRYLLFHNYLPFAEYKKQPLSAPEPESITSFVEAKYENVKDIKDSSHRLIYLNQNRKYLSASKRNLFRVLSQWVERFYDLESIAQIFEADYNNWYFYVSERKINTVFTECGEIRYNREPGDPRILCYDHEYVDQSLIHNYELVNSVELPPTLHYKDKRGMEE